jgi:hypothetical protein
MSTLPKLVQLADEAPWCGTRPPGIHLPHPPRPFAEAFEPHPSPWRELETIAALWQSIRLFQVGQRVGTMADTTKQLGQAVQQSAIDLFDDQCGSVPLSVLISWILHNPPPPPPWLQQIIGAAEGLEMGLRLSGEVGKQMQGVSRGMITENLPGAGQAART